MCEVIKNGKEIILNKLFEFNFEKNKLVKINEGNKIIDKIKKTFSVNEKEIKKMLKEKEKLIEKLYGKVNFQEFFELAEQE